MGKFRVTLTSEVSRKHRGCKYHLQIMVLDTNMQLKVSGFFPAMDGQPLCEKLVMLLQQGVKVTYLYMDNVGEKINIWPKE